MYVLGNQIDVGFEFYLIQVFENKTHILNIITASFETSKNKMNQPSG
jgi:hypothetical protein